MSAQTVLCLLGGEVRCDEEQRIEQIVGCSMEAAYFDVCVMMPGVKRSRPMNRRSTIFSSNC